jgi:L-seryl-tRNA(Ser) seleniumtransferase
VMLVLNTLALNHSVPVSRGELVEIGGSFRIPDIVARAGCHLVEVGTTNRTHSADYANAIDESTSLLLKVHPSNYHVEGFTKTVNVRELKKIGTEHHLPVCVDLGSGTLIDLKRYGLPHEPTPKEILAEGADLVTFSGDKLLGSVQAGIIVGRADLVAMLNSNPLKRALRADKITLSILDTTLRAYENEETLVENIPLLQTLTLSPSILDSRAKIVSEKLRYLLPECSVAIEDSTSQLGSGALPEARLPSRAVTIRGHGGSTTTEIEKKLRRLAIPVIGRLQEARLWLDMRGADPINELITNLEALA